MSIALIGLGANIDDPARQITDAVRAMCELPQTRVDAVSSIYRSAPMGPNDQPDFLNACALLSTRLAPEVLLTELQAIEQRQGRVRHRHWGERCIDLDLLVYDHITLSTEHLTVPHPGVRSRDFVLIPAIELLGADWTLPCGSTLGACLEAAEPHHVTPVEPADPQHHRACTDVRHA